MSAVLSVITIGIDPTIEVGPVEIAWHGLTIAIGIVIGGIAVAYDAVGAAWSRTASTRSG